MWPILNENVLICQIKDVFTKNMQLNATLRAYASLIRVPYILMVDFLCVLLILTFQKGFYDLGTMGLAVLAVSLVIAGSAAINDYFDCESDRLSHPERAIPSNEISLIRAAQFAAVTFFAGLAVSSVINVLAFGIVALNVVLFVLYPRVIKRFSGFLSNLVMGYLGATIALFAGAVVFKTINIASLSFAGMIAAAAVGLNVLKDVLTVDGDLKAGYPTLAIKGGIRTAAIVGALFLLLSVVTSPLPYLVGAVGVAYLIAVAVWGGIGLFTALSLFKAPDPANVRMRLRTFNSSFPYIVGAASVVYALLIATWGLH
jgi:geranylgeranylglycerol-phosphate geranylgeranyltransferase